MNSVFLKPTASVTELGLLRTKATLSRLEPSLERMTQQLSRMVRKVETEPMRFGTNGPARGEIRGLKRDALHRRVTALIVRNLQNRLGILPKMTPSKATYVRAAFSSKLPTAEKCQLRKEIHRELRVEEGFQSIHRNFLQTKVEMERKFAETEKALNKIFDDARSRLES